MIIIISKQNSLFYIEKNIHVIFKGKERKYSFEKDISVIILNDISVARFFKFSPLQYTDCWLDKKYLDKIFCNDKSMELVDLRI